MTRCFARTILGQATTRRKSTHSRLRDFDDRASNNSHSLRGIIVKQNHTYLHSLGLVQWPCCSSHPGEQRAVINEKQLLEKQKQIGYATAWFRKSAEIRK